MPMANAAALPYLERRGLESGVGWDDSDTGRNGASDGTRSYYGEYVRGGVEL